MVRGGFFLFVVALTAPSLAVAETLSFGDSAAALAKACGAAWLRTGGGGMATSSP